MLALGIFLGMTYDAKEQFIPKFSTRLNSVLDQIEYLYVDTIDRSALEEIAVEAIVDELDPHSLYFTSDEIKAMSEPMEGGFEGIGVEFIITNDTLMVVNALQGGPSEAAGIRGGDRILKVDTLEISGRDLTNSKVMKLLKGKGGTKVDLTLMRGGSGEIYDVTITRARIPIHSVVASFKVTEDIGYVKVIRFAATTAYEFASSMDELVANGATSIIVDLRGNGGGYLKAATDMIELFLTEGLEIVYTEGKSSPKFSYTSQLDGVFSNMPITVLIDESSASASEIFAGALQDNDRGLIIGRRSFGKGLVQEEFDVAIDGALRLTVARFYTPSGRPIQKPYGEDIDYSSDRSTRIESGELFHQDSIRHADSLTYYTTLGRTVYGGGGITPDVFIPLDTSSTSRDLAELIWAGAVRDGAFNWGDRNRQFLAGLSSYEELRGSEIWGDPVNGGLAEIMKEFNELMGYSPAWEAEEAAIIEERFYFQVIRNFFGEEAFYKVISTDDEYIERAIFEMKEVSWFGLREGRLYLLPSNIDK